MKDFILTCGCGETDKFAATAFRLLFKEKPMPPINHSSGRLEGDQVNKMVEALGKSKEKFAYYFSEEEIWDLLKGVRIG